LDDRPLWVRVSLWKVPSRGLAWGYFWLSIAITAGCVAWGFIDSRFFSGTLFLIAAGFYLASILWMDRNHRW
jgi:hypothetical protein